LQVFLESPGCDQKRNELPDFAPLPFRRRDAKIARFEFMELDLCACMSGFQPKPMTQRENAAKHDTKH
jgi:hypothetical protein